MRPNGLSKLAICRAPVKFACQPDKERGGIDAAIVTAERNLAERCHFAAAGFVQDFAGLGILSRIDFARLRLSEISKNTACQCRVEPETFQSGYQTIAAEWGAEPGNSCVRIGTSGHLRVHHGQICGGPAQPLVEPLIGGANYASAVLSRLQFLFRLGISGLKTWGCCGAMVAIACDSDFQTCFSVRRQRGVKKCFGGKDC